MMVVAGGISTSIADPDKIEAPNTGPMEPPTTRKRVFMPEAIPKSFGALISTTTSMTDTITNALPILERYADYNVKDGPVSQHHVQ